MPEYKLTYFNLTGLAESIRYLLTYAGADFEDNRLPRADWPTLKESLPYKKLPVLEVNGKVLNQSVSICRYIAQKHGLEHKDLWTRAQLEAIVDGLKDLYPHLTQYFKEKTPENKKVADDAVMELFTQLNTLAAKGFFYGSPKPTWVDVYFVGTCDTLANFLGDILSPHPNLVTLVDKIKSNEKISKYIKNRPAPEA